MDKVICRGCFNPKKIFNTGLFLFIHDRAKQTDRQTNAHTHKQAILNWLLMYVLSFVLFIKIPTLDITIRIMHLRRCWSNILYIYVHNMHKERLHISRLPMIPYVFFTRHSCVPGVSQYWMYVFKNAQTNITRELWRGSLA